jgi:hypothetical protein
MSNLPQKLPLDMLQTKWASQLNPVLNNPLVAGLLLENIALINGTTIINHKLGRKLQGWLIVGINAAATVYDNQATNQNPQLTLSLTSNAAAIVSLWCF